MDKKHKKTWLLNKNKKGEATDALTFVFWLFVISIGIVAVMFAFLSLMSPLRQSALGEDVNSLAAINSIEAYISTSLPSAGLIIYFGLILGVLVTSFFIRSHPIFIPVYIILGMATIFVAVVLGNAWSNITEIEGFSEIVELNSYIGIMDTILNNIVIMTLFVFILSLVITFAKPGGAQVQQSSEPF